MSNKITLATIQFRADAKGVNPALDAMRRSAKDAHDEMDRLQEALDRGVKKMKDAGGVEFDVADRLRAATKEAKSFDQSIRELIKGATALESVVKNIGAGRIEDSSRAELKGAINGAQSRLRSVRGSDPESLQMQRELNIVIEESRKQLNNLDRDTAKVIETIEHGGSVAQSVLKQEQRGLEEMLTLIPRGTAEWEQYNAQLQKIQGGLLKIRESAGADVLARAQRGEFATASTSELSEAIRQLKEYQAIIHDPKGTGAETFAATKEQIKALSAALDELTEKSKKGFANADEAIAAFNRHMNEIPTERVITQAETLAKAESERLKQAFNESTEAVRLQQKSIDDYEREMREAAQEVVKLEAELDKLQQRQASRRNGLGRVMGLVQEGDDDKAAAMQDAHKLDKWMPWSRREERRMQEMRERLEGNEYFFGARERESYYKQEKTAAEENLVYMKQEQEQQRIAYEEAVAQEERLRAAEQERFEQNQQGQRMRREEMLNAIKAIEDEALTIDRTTADGQKRWEGMRATIDQMNEELKVASGEMMSLADAQALADKAMGEQALTAKTGWAAGTEELKRAEQTLAEKVAKAKRGTAEEEAAYQKLERQLKAVRTELNAGGMSGKQMMAVLANPKNVTSVDTLKAAIGRARQELDALGRRIDQAKMDKNNREARKLQKAYDDLAKSVQQTDIRMKELQNSSKGTATAFEKAWSRLKTYVGLYVGAAVAMQKLVSTMGDLMELSDKMGEVRKTTGFTADEVGRLSNNLAKLDTRTTLTSLMELSSLAGSVGLKTQEQVQGFTEAADQLIVALPELGNESARTIIKIANATGDLEKNGGNVRETLEKVGSTIIALRANSASAAGPITDFVSRVGAVGAQAGISIDQIAALGSTIDALGGRVEMSATALSRMIPAIKNNSFAIANSIGVTEKYLKSLAPMEQMVLIFQKMRDNIQHIDTSTEQGQEQMAQTIEGMLGRNATMREVMKDLEQQGARAGIVFGLLSQNVDELEKQLGIASNAYRENTALANEFANMNETAAAKWERLKNQVEEFFVGDQTQRWLGNIIDGLRKVVDLLTGNGGVSVGLRAVLLYLGMVKLQVISLAKGALASIAGGLKNIFVMLGFIKGEMNALQWGNIFTAAAAAVGYFVYSLKQAHDTLAEARKELGRWAQEILKSQQAVEENFTAVDKARKSIDEANKKVTEARAALEKARKEMDGSEESAKRLKEAEENLKKAEEGLTTANDAHRSSIEQINKLYGSYLGFMLSEVARSEELINARDLINAKLRETITLKRKEAALERVEENTGGKRDEAYGKLSQALSGSIRQQVVVGRTKGKNGKIVEQKGWTTNFKESEKLLRQITKLAQAEEMTSEQVEKALANAGLNIYEKGSNGKTRINAYGANLRELVKNYRKEYMAVEKEVSNVEKQFDAQMAVDREDSQKYLKKQYKEAEKTYAQLEEKHANAQGGAKKKAAADLLKQSDSLQDMVKNAKNFYDLNNEDEQKAYDKFISDSQKRIDGIEAQREALLKEAGDAYKPATGSSAAKTFTGAGSTNPYGTYNRVTSPYQDWDADALVSRRKEMLERVRALANGADVQAVLSEDAKFISEATRRNIKDTKQAIEWYNTERLKIQEALHEKHLTNTGDWMDPKKGGRKASKLVQDEMKYYLDELDAYYTERKTRIQEAATDEGITEAEMKNRTLANEMEWHQRRAELQKLYAKKSAEVTKEEQDAIFDILSDRTGETTSYIEKDIANTVKFIEKVGKEKGRPAMERILGDLGLGIERDFLEQQQALTTQMKAIRDIIEKERPYDGITRNLRENLVMMGILTADMAEERNRLMRENADMSEFNSRQAAEELKRTAFMLGEAENAYSTTIEEVMRHMGEKGMQAWAEAIRSDKQMQQALMAQLRTAYDQIQDAIKKEASLIKKQTDIWWADIAQGQTQSRRDVFEKELSRLGLAEDQVKRANSLIGAGYASERVADKLAIKQMQVRLEMLQTYYAKMRQIGEERIRQLEAAGRLEDAEHLRRSLNLAKTEELKKLEEQRVAIANQMEESQNRLYTALKEWADLFSSSLQSVFEASNTGQKEFYTEQAKKRLTGASTSGEYIVVEHAGTKDAEASYQTLSDQEVLDIEQRNAMADAWKKLMDDLNAKMNDTITDQLNAMIQNASIDANTDALSANTRAMLGLTEALGGDAVPAANATGTVAGSENDLPPAVSDADPESFERYMQWVQTYGEGQQEIERRTQETNKNIQKSTASAFAKMTAAANLYGVAYQAMSNDNMTAAQKFGMIAVQSAGQAAITALTTNMSQTTGQVAADTPSVLSKLWSQLGWGAVPVFAIFTGLLGGLMGLAASKIAKSKAEIAQATGVSASAGRLTTGMKTYAKGNVNEFTDPSTLTPGKQYDVDAADGHTYRARYMGSNPKTHLTNGPEFHLSGERGREMIIDAGTTRQITMNEREIWHAIQTLSGGGRLAASRRHRGIRAFAGGNLDELDGMDNGQWAMDNAGGGFGAEQMAAFQSSLDRNSAVQEALLERLSQPLQAEVSPYGPRGIVQGYDNAKKMEQRHGAKA